MKYEDRYRGKCLIYIDRTGIYGKIMYIMETEVYRLIVDERYADFKTYQEAFDCLVAL